MNKIRPFHLAISVSDLKHSKKFYKDILGCRLGRSSDTWIDLNFFEHQLVIHTGKVNIKKTSNYVDGYNVPVPHFGVILSWDQWHQFSKKIRNKIKFEIEPHVRFKGKIGEQATMFFMDPDNNALEFKAFKNDSQIFDK